MKILVTGATGQLGVDVVSLLTQKRFEVFAYSREELDITDECKVSEIVTHHSPDAIIHTAAYTKVDLAEKEIDLAYQVNAVGTRNVVVAAEHIGAKFCYISTDYVFDGSSAIPYQEYDRVNPVSIYGKSKYAGEQLTQSLSSKYFIVRTSWVYGIHGHNFVKTMLRLAKEKDQLSVVHDQIGAPTFTIHLAEFLIDLITTERYGIYHASNSGVCSWYEFAQAIFVKAGIQINLHAITTDEYPTPALRPAYSVLDDLGIRVNGFQTLPHWEVGLDHFFQIYKNNRN